MQNKITLLLCIATLLLTGCYKEPAVTQDQVIVKMPENKSAIPADGLSRQKISVEINAHATDVSNTIVLTTTKGIFDGAAKNTITVSAQNTQMADGMHKIATVYLISSNDEGVAYVTAAIKNYTQIDTIYFARAYPDLIRLQLDKINLQSGTTGEITATVQIKRNTGTGTPSFGQTITLTALDAAQHTIGNFRNLILTTDATGSCVNYFSLPVGNTFTGVIQLIATVPTNTAGGIASDTQTITVYK
jgi:hypothetical protein